MNEIWKDIEGYNDLYQISNLGRVKSLGRRGNGCSLEDRILKPMINKDGYHLVNLKDINHVAKWFTVHRLVALHFLMTRAKLQSLSDTPRLKPGACP